MNDTNPTRVLYSFPHRFGAPGIGSTAWHMVDNLVRLGTQVHVACSSHERPVDDAASIRTTMALGPVRVPHRAFGSIDRAMEWHDQRVARRLEKMKHQVDLVHGWPSGSLATIRTARKLGIPFALERPSAHTRLVYETNHRLSVELGLDVPKSSYADSNTARLEREQMEFDLADVLLCPSDFVVKTFEDEGYGETLVRHHYGFDPKRFTPPQSTNDDGERPLRVAYVGKCFPLKGLHVALDAWFRSGVAERGRFTICGDFEAGYEAVLGPKLAHPSIEHLGFRNDVEAVLRQCDVLVLPSAAEGSALVGYEARATGCLLLASTASGVPAIHETNALLHEFGDAERLAQQLAKLDSDRPYLERLRETSVRDIQDFTWLRASARLREVYAGMLNP